MYEYEIDKIEHWKAEYKDEGMFVVYIEISLDDDKYLLDILDRAARKT